MIQASFGLAGVKAAEAIIDPSLSRSSMKRSATLAARPPERLTVRRSKRDVITSLRQPKVAVMLMLGFSSGLPFLLTGNTLGYWLRDEGTTLGQSGSCRGWDWPIRSSSCGHPSSSRVDAPVFGRFGRRRGWMIVSQFLVAIGLVGLSAVGLKAGLATLGFLALVVAFASSTQDIVVGRVAD